MPVLHASATLIHSRAVRAENVTCAARHGVEPVVHLLHAAEVELVEALNADDVAQAGSARVDGAEGRAGQAAVGGGQDAAGDAVAGHVAAGRCGLAAPVRAVGVGGGVGAVRCRGLRLGLRALLFGEQLAGGGKWGFAEGLVACVERV